MATWWAIRLLTLAGRSARDGRLKLPSSDDSLGLTVPT